jgi:hypothetical protein
VEKCQCSKFTVRRSWFVLEYPYGDDGGEFGGRVSQLRVEEPREPDRGGKQGPRLRAVQSRFAAAVDEAYCGDGR